MNGRTYEGEEACKILNTSQPLAITLDAAGIPPLKYRELASQPDKPITWPAQNPPKWYIQLDRQSLIGIYTGEFNNDAPRSTEIFPNLDNHYLRTIINRKHGKVLVIRAKAPKTPATFYGNESMEESELRYWSVCSNQSFGNTRVNDCLFDEEIPVDKNGFFTHMISKLKDKPRNAIVECGIACCLLPRMVMEFLTMMWNNSISTHVVIRDFSEFYTKRRFSIKNKRNNERILPKWSIPYDQSG